MAQDTLEKRENYWFNTIDHRAWLEQSDFHRNLCHYNKKSEVKCVICHFCSFSLLPKPNRNPAKNDELSKLKRV